MNLKKKSPQNLFFTYNLCAMEFFILSMLVGANILIDLYDKWFNDKEKPLSTNEFLFYMYDKQEEIKKILEEQNKDLRMQMFNNYLKTRDLINIKNNEKENKKGI